VYSSIVGCLLCALECECECEYDCGVIGEGGTDCLGDDEGLDNK